MTETYTLEGPPSMRGRGTAAPGRARRPATPGSRRLHFCVTSQSQGRRGETARQAAGHCEKWPNWANAPEIPPGRLRGGLRRGPQTPARGLTSRKGAVCGRDVTERRILPTPHAHYTHHTPPEEFRPLHRLQVSQAHHRGTSTTIKTGSAQLPVTNTQVGT